MGFRRCVMPAANIDRDAQRPLPRQGRPAGARQTAPDRHETEDGSPSRVDEADCELVGVRTVGEALDALLS
jgi:hypothetical protein